MTRRLDAVVTDIEGTTTSIAFVHETLFPYSREHIGTFVEEHRDDPSVRSALDELASMAKEEGHPAANVHDLVTFARALIAEDRKAGPLKALQGLLWEEGYRVGAFRSHVFKDVPGALARLRDEGVRLYVYSSGSVHAQKLLFGHTEVGDLTPLFAGYFDTTTGPKREAGSYDRIARAIGAPKDRILFLSDVVAELDAATEAGLQAIGLKRPGNAPQGPSAHRFIESFDDLDVG